MTDVSPISLVKKRKPLVDFDRIESESERTNLIYTLMKIGDIRAHSCIAAYEGSSEQVLRDLYVTYCAPTYRTVIDVHILSHKNCPMDLVDEMTRGLKREMLARSILSNPNMPTEYVRRAIGGCNTNHVAKAIVTHPNVDTETADAATLVLLRSKYRTSTMQAVLDCPKVSDALVQRFASASSPLVRMAFYRSPRAFVETLRQAVDTETHQQARQVALAELEARTE